MAKRISFLLYLIAFIFIISAKQVYAMQPLPKEFEEIYKEILKDPSYASMGNPKGKYVIIDFFDYRCNFCKQLHTDLYNLVHSKQGKNIRWISIETPVFGYQHNYASDIILATRKYGLYNKIFDISAQRGHMGQSEIYRLFEELGGDKEQLREDVKNTEFRPIYKKHFDIYRLFNTTAVPVVIINKKYQIGGLKEGQLDEIIKEANPPRVWETLFLRFF